MTWYAWALIAYIVIDRIVTVAYVGRSIDIKPSTAVANLITGALLVWGVVALAVGS